ncbi:unnamed protein product [Darwinula stevensoni]|uniref:Terpene utilization protein AtuA n=1 Tax=Darwinula stevensoni TaxID=69355 RepID=A0A7R8X0L6_9CRUS|nr:unnamed protein product [Darwinula stevensoni]CAG0879312.1 unnamed protein product [Darwinula stevensoni]
MIVNEALKRCFRATYSQSRCFSIVRSSYSTSQSKEFDGISRSGSSPTSTNVRIGCASGFWGDTAVAAPQLIYMGNLDYLVFDYLSEITMSLLTAAKMKKDTLGYAPDFLTAGIGPYLNDIKRKGIRVVSNAGGVNPLSCSWEIQSMAKKAGLDLKIACVTGDDLISNTKAEVLTAFKSSFSMKDFSKVTSMNTYLGAGPIAQALDMGADVVVTGRCVDSALVLGPLVHHVCATYRDGYRATGLGGIVGPRAVEKGKRTGHAILSRCRSIFKKLGLKDFSDVNVQVLGSESSYGAHARELGCRETVLWVAVTHDEKVALEIFGRELAPAGTGMAPGLTLMAGGRPKASPVLRLHSFLIPKSLVQVTMGERSEAYILPEYSKYAHLDAEASASVTPLKEPDVLLGSLTFTVGDLAYTRSGDKSDTANIGVIARKPGFLPYLRKALTEEALGEYFAHLFPHDSTRTQASFVKRYEVPGILGLNFVLESSLGGGGVASLRFDPQGKGLGQMLLDFPIHEMPPLNEIK